jgi:hypothetical protein
MFSNKQNKNFTTKRGINNDFFQITKRLISSKRHHTNFDMKLNNLTSLGSKHLSLSRVFALLNAGLFLYVNLRLSNGGQWLGLEGVSYSVDNHEKRDYINLFSSLLGSRRVDDLVLEAGVLSTLGHSLETLYGRPFFAKLFIFTYYMGMMSSAYWVDSNLAKRERYHTNPNPFNRMISEKNNQEYRYMSSHGFAMSLVYFYMMKKPSLRLAILPVLAADLFVWGPYYSAGAISGIAAGMIL